MLSKERLFRIMEVIEEQSFVTISELMEFINASKSTITRDLMELERQGLIQRERGGAIRKELPQTLSSSTDLPVMNKENIHLAEKELIGKAAAEIVKNGECIYLDSGTTPVAMLPYLKDKNIKLVTASTYLVRKLPKRFKGELFLIGGHYIPDYDMSVGFVAIEDINRFHFDQAFFSASGIDLESEEVMAVDLDISAVKAAVLKRCRKAHILADASKLQVQALATWAHTTDFDTIFMNAPTTVEQLPDNFHVCKE